MTTTQTNTKLSETEALREDLELTRQHPKAAAAVGGVATLAVGATAWIMGRSK
ncbi:hypothetical protein [Kribbella sp. VKM Ac-2568]|uniref:hypothetical protein n=1 Tax=Kribbella sp. VKM Ac-2568 TaxID=2512219 RepID=UPI0010EFC4E5|nr:hypothetical protein [Kribbella sp. VKM Ac-2568]TCM48912.1 hypothetical protein EV648_103177 [Kribbella sp. VKM Ac-2568]